MRFALIDNKKVEAKPGLKNAICPGCLQPVIAKCGDQKINHWAHYKKCDSWWEPETEWHRAWKDKFPTDWQEIYLPDTQTGEKHIADVRTAHGLVIEFQHSHIDPKERVIREKFYQNMIWVVDGTRRKNDYQRFCKGNESYTHHIKISINSAYLDKQGREVHTSIDICLISSLNQCFPLDWIISSVPVIFDFQGNIAQNDLQNKEQNILWCLFPWRIGNYAVTVPISREYFISETYKSKILLPYTNIMNGVIAYLNMQNRARLTYAPKKHNCRRKFRF